MSAEPGPAEAERANLRSRRLVEAARLLPVVGLFLFLLPLLWAAGSGPPGTAAGGLYIFGVWGGLIAAAVVLARPLRRRIGAPDDGRGDKAEPGA